jgi:hypothetical protein
MGNLFAGKYHHESTSDLQERLSSAKARHQSLRRTMMLGVPEPETQERWKEERSSLEVEISALEAELRKRADS